MRKEIVFKPKPATTPMPTAAEAWVDQGGQKEGRAPLTMVPEAPEEKPRKMVRFTLDVDAELHSRMKVACAMKGEKMSDVLRAVLMKEFPSE
ncbi:hypothetical protein E3C22_24275 [Jiella endophytica]|uniref:Chromosome partitioning protein ParB n=1 Tax=Jiella endophytica TaxID=2558362 RepID=A0A4Y8R6S2_9HYPH|nr:plasmid partition protein ParG [Jiella endophytica]TFF17197.1 hypothetical protein E3C22_24275 [Jiella endophytica]